MTSRPERRTKIHRRIRKVSFGTAERPRLSVYRSLNHVYAQLIDDASGKTLAAASSLGANGSLKTKAEAVGAAIAKSAKEQKIKEAVYDRAGFAYAGAVAVLADQARKEGLKI
jgi:large subunit ribosomal protein L18